MSNIPRVNLIPRTSRGFVAIPGTIRGAEYELMISRPVAFEVDPGPYTPNPKPSTICSRPDRHQHLRQPRTPRQRGTPFIMRASTRNPKPETQSPKPAIRHPKRVQDILLGGASIRTQHCKIISEGTSLTLSVREDEKCKVS